MLSNRSIERLAGAFMVIGLISFIAHSFTLEQGVRPITILLVLVYGVMIILSAWLIYRVFYSHERTLAQFGAFGLAVHGVFVIVVCALLLAQLKFRQEFVATVGPETDAATTAARALALAMNMIRTSTFLFLGLGLVPLGALISSSGAVARWIGWLGIVAGILGFLVVLAALFDVIVGRGMFLGSVLLMFGFVLILGIRLVVRETREVHV